MQGVSSDKFNPDGTVTRGMIVSVLYRLEGSPAVDNKALFSDVSSDKYYSSAVTWASENGIISGYSDGNFGPDDTPVNSWHRFYTDMLNINAMIPQTLQTYRRIRTAER